MASHPAEHWQSSSSKTKIQTLKTSNCNSSFCRHFLLCFEKALEEPLQLSWVVRRSFMLTGHRLCEAAFAAFSLSHSCLCCFQCCVWQSLPQYCKTTTVAHSQQMRDDVPNDAGPCCLCTQVTHDGGDLLTISSAPATGLPPSRPHTCLPAATSLTQMLLQRPHTMRAWNSWLQLAQGFPAESGAGVTGSTPLAMLGHGRISMCSSPGCTRLRTCALRMSSYVNVLRRLLPRPRNLSAFFCSDDRQTVYMSASPYQLLCTPRPYTCLMHAYRQQDAKVNQLLMPMLCLQTVSCSQQTSLVWSSNH